MKIHFLKFTKDFAKSVWLFPALLTILLLLLTAFKIHGSSLGVYHTLFYGNSNDPNLIINKPLPIRSDEWLVNSQATISQGSNGFERINKNIGNGEDISVIIDAPYKDWSVIFKPQNLAFFVLPFDNAFAFKWWFMGYLLIISCYFFILALLPKRKLLASLLSVSLFFAPFIQWWYLSGTLGAICYSLLGGTILIKLFDSQKLKQSMLLGLFLIYIITCFVLILYPPFQIPCALVMLAFAIGYLLEKNKTTDKKIILQKLTIIACAIAIAGLITFAFLQTRSDTINTIQNTAYPGHRSLKSGGFDALHLFSSHLGKMLSNTTTFGHYRMFNAPTNQSEASNFILILPFLLLPSFYLLYRYYLSKRQIYWPLILTILLFFIMLVWLFIPNLPILGKLFLLEKVGQQGRLLIGLGLLNIISLVLFITLYLKLKNFIIEKKWAALYASMVFLTELILGIFVMQESPGFIGISRVLLYSLPLPIFMYFLLRKHFEIAASILLLFSIYMTFRVNPLYKGTDAIRKTSVSVKINSIAKQDNGAWVTDNMLLENFASVNGARSLSGVYAYPQLELWKDGNQNTEEFIYNRYAHIVFDFDRNPNQQVPLKMSLPQTDNIRILVEPCGDFLNKKGVRYVLTTAKLNPMDDCASLVDQISYPEQTLYIYKLAF